MTVEDNIISINSDMKWNKSYRNYPCLIWCRQIKVNFADIMSYHLTSSLYVVGELGNNQIRRSMRVDNNITFDVIIGISSIETFFVLFNTHFIIWLQFPHFHTCVLYFSTTWPLDKANDHRRVNHYIDWLLSVMFRRFSRKADFQEWTDKLTTPGHHLLRGTKTQIHEQQHFKNESSGCNSFTDLH